MTAYAGHERLGQAADFGIRAWGASAEEAFEQAAWGLVDMLGIPVAGPGSRLPIAAIAGDRAALLVEFLNELIYVQESENAGFASIEVRRVSDTELEAELELVPLEGAPGGTVVKAAAYRGLQVEDRADGAAEVRVFFDV